MTFFSPWGRCVFFYFVLVMRFKRVNDIQVRKLIPHVGEKNYRRFLHEHEIQKLPICHKHFKERLCFYCISDTFFPDTKNSTSSLGFALYTVWCVAIIETIRKPKICYPPTRQYELMKKRRKEKEGILTMKSFNQEMRHFIKNLSEKDRKKRRLLINRKREALVKEYKKKRDYFIERPPMESDDEDMNIIFDTPIDEDTFFNIWKGTPFQDVDDLIEFEKEMEQVYKNKTQIVE